MQVQLPSVRGQLRRCREQHYWSSQSQTTGDWHGQQLFLSIHTINAGPRRCKLALKPGSAKAECPGKARGVLATSFAWVGPQGAIRHQPGQSWILGRKSQRAGSPGTSNATREPCARRVGKPPQRTQKVAVRRSVISAKSTRGYGFTTTRREGGRERRRRNDKTHTTHAARHGQPHRKPPAQPTPAATTKLKHGEENTTRNELPKARRHGPRTHTLQ